MHVIFITLNFYTTLIFSSFIYIYWMEGISILFYVILANFHMNRTGFTNVLIAAEF